VNPEPHVGSVKRAFVLGAGLGTRLRPLTGRLPKPLVPLYHKPLITFAFDHLLGAGVESFVVNTHHCPEAFSGEFATGEYRGHPLQFRNEPVLLDTGGGIKNVEDLLGAEPFVVYNGDVLADFPIGPAIGEHLRSGNLATLVLRSGGGPLHIQWNPATKLVSDIRGALGNRTDPSFLFSGISILSPEIFPRIPGGRVVSIIPVYLDLVRSGRVGGVLVDEGLWLDLGSRAAYLDAHRILGPAGHRLSHAAPGWPCPVHPSAQIHPGARLLGACAVGPGAVVGEGATLRDCVLWKNAAVAAGAQLESCIVRDGQRAQGLFRDADF